MSSWLTFVVGIILGLLIGWFIDLLYRRRKEVAAPEAVESAASVPEPAAPPGEAAPVTAAAAVAEETRQPAADVEMVDEAPHPSEAAAEPEPPALPEAPAESQPPDWPAVSERVAEVAEEVEAPPPAPQVAAGMPVVEEGLPPAAVAALASEQAEERASAMEVGAEAQDRLILIEGIGPVYEAKLHAAGIYTFRQLVETSDDRLREIIEPTSWQRINFGEWREQAQLLVEGKDEELKALYARLFSRKKG